MFLVKTTGQNKNYGKEDEVTTIADQFLIYCLKDKVIYPKVYYLGKQSGKSYEHINKLIKKFRKEVN